MSKQEAMKLQTCVLRVNIHCDGCKKKVKKLLQKIEGVYTVGIDAEQGKVTVTGAVDPIKLIKKLENSGKHAELWGPSKNFSNQNNNLSLGFGNQLKNMQLENGKFGKQESKSPNFFGGNKNAGGQQKHQQQKQIMKGVKDMKMVPSKEQKKVKFDLPEEDEFDTSGDDFDDEFGDDDDSFDDDFGDEFGRGHHQKPSKGSMAGGDPHGHKGNKEKGNAKKKAGGGSKKGSFFDSIPFLMKGFGKKSDPKHGKEGKKNGGDGGGGGGDGKNKGGEDKDVGKSGILSGNFGKTSDFGELIAKNKGGNGAGTGGGGNNGNNGAKKAGGKNNDKTHPNNKALGSFNGLDHHHHHAGNLSNSMIGGRGGEDSMMGGMGGYPMSHMGGYPMGQMGGGMPAAVQGLPAMNGGGYYQNPYQQQYMGMMMNQHQQLQHHSQGNGMYQPMMYARPPQPVGYVPPMPPPASDPYVHMFSDESTESCSVM